VSGLRETLEAATLAGYDVTYDGRVLSRTNWRGTGLRELTQTPNADGYPSVRLSIHGERRHIAVHRLVAAAYLPPPAPGQQLRHLDGDKTNNRASNLAWGTAAENAADRELHGRTARGESNGFSRLTTAQVDEIRRRYSAGEGNQHELADEFGVHQTHISRIVRGTRRVQG